MTESPLRSALAALLAVLIIACPVPSAAQLDEGGELFYGFNLNASLGGAIPTTDEFSNSFYFRLGGGYEISPNFSLEVGMGRFATEVEHGMDTPPANTVADGEMKVIPLTLALQLRYPVPQMFGTVYGLVGLGYYFIDYSWSGSSEEYFDEVEALYGPAVQSVSDSVGFQLGAGYDYPLSANMFLNLEGQYVILSPEASGSWRDVVTGERHSFDGDISLNTWIFSLGVKYLF